MKYDIAVIGGGPAGYTAALEAIKYGYSVVLFEKNLIGGTCLNRGCIPTKYLSHISEMIYGIKNAERFGVTVDSLNIDFKKTIAKKDGIVLELRENLDTYLKNKGVTIVKGTAALKCDGSILCNGEEYDAINTIIATGSKQSETTIALSSISSDEALSLESVPKTIKILGGGVIAVEFANIFNQLGSDVTIAIRGDRILRKWDKELAVSITQVLKKNGVKIKTNCSPEDFNDGEYDCVLSAFGRIPELQGIDTNQIEVDSNGAIIVKKDGSTSQRNVYAIGDVISGSDMLAHIAMEQGKRVIHSISGKNDDKDIVVAECIYISPEVASVGLTEMEAKEKNINYVLGKINLLSNARTLISTESRSFIKVLADKDTRKIIGAQLMCERASDIASEFVVVIKNGLTIDQIKSSVHPHPSYSEAIIDVMDVLVEKADGI